MALLQSTETCLSINSDSVPSGSCTGGQQTTSAAGRRIADRPSVLAAVSGRGTPSQQRPPPVLYAGGSPWRRLSRSQARTAWWCELAWPGQAAHPAGSYNSFTQVQLFQLACFSPSELSRNQLRRRHRHHGLVSGPFFVVGIKCVIPPWDMSCNSSEAFLSRSATYEPTRPTRSIISFDHTFDQPHRRH
jgi:hypothetical protein